MKITFGILAHVDAGKTTFSEQVLYKEKVIKTPGRVDTKSSYLDHDEIEKARGITIFSDIAVFTHHSNTYYLVDTPGHMDFSSEMERTLEIMDYAVLVVNGSDGIQGHTETIWNLLKRYDIPVFLFINKLDLDSSSYERTISEVQNQFSTNILDFNQVHLEAGGEGTFTDDLINNLSEDKEDLLDQWLEGTVQYEDLLEVLILRIKERKLFPCFGGSALSGTGIDLFLHAFYEFAKTSYKSNDTFSARIFKIRYDNQQERMAFMKILGGSLKVRDSILGSEKVHQIRIFNGERFQTVSQAYAGDIIAVTGLESTLAGQGIGACSDNAIPVLAPALQAKVLYSKDIPNQSVIKIFHLLQEEDPSLRMDWEESLQQLKVNFMGKIQLEVLEQSVLTRFQIPVTFGPPEVLYMETIRQPVTGYGHFEPLRHYSEVAFRLEPAPRGAGILFKSQCHVDRLGINYQNLICTHVFEKNHKGVLTGAVLTDVKVILIDGISHIKHTEGGDFREAVYRAIRQGLMKAECMVLEPYYRFRLLVPEELCGRLLNDILRRHGTFEPPVIEEKGRAVIAGIGPVSSFMNYGEELMIMSGGRAGISMTFSHYDICHNEEEIIADSQYNPDADIENPSGSVFCQKGTSFVVNWDEAEQYMHTLR
ncbi:TetM/TetW/TetO/TetS family tetracycline resistance ribosomal protection protein [Clostridium sp. HBUAS56010]|uniref:GTP-binding protein n=1 Tax=Clostridium sp. HBUAS56010 TaxID=2571127 RepID=UPI001177E013|nr:TetM/TetW/TetO/TetS family tetracycline resistance ribosomal protection protein [Clostridium sp. HBUAS56010]